MPEPITIGLTAAAVLAYLKSRGGGVQGLATTTLNEALGQGNPIAGTLTLETVRDALPAGAFRDVVDLITANATPATVEAATQDAAGIPVDPLVATAAIEDLREHVEPAALAVALLLITAGLDLATRKLEALLPHPEAAPVAALPPADVVTALLDNLTADQLEHIGVLSRSLPTAAAPQLDTAEEPDGSAALTIRQRNLDGSITVQQLEVDPAGAVRAFAVATLGSPAAIAAPGILTSGGLTLPPAAQQAAAAVFPQWSGRWRALNGVTAAATPQPGATELTAWAGQVL
jgi:hypothetical protein